MNMILYIFFVDTPEKCMLERQTTYVYLFALIGTSKKMMLYFISSSIFLELRFVKKLAFVSISGHLNGVIFFIHVHIAILNGMGCKTNDRVET